MNLYDRWLMAYQSPLGSLLIVLVVFLGILGLAYWALMENKRKRDLLAYLYHSYYEKAQAAAPHLSFLDKHKADFFGRETIVKLPSQTIGVCLIPPPELADEAVCHRFLRFLRTTAPRELPGCARYLWTHVEKAFLLVKGDLLQQNQRFILSLSHYLRDSKLSQADRESILLAIAKTLSQLHDLTTDAGEPLYHGFLLPRSIYLDLDAQQRINRVLLADVGLAFAIGPEKLCRRLEILRAGKLPIEKYLAQELLEQYPMLAPEQKDPQKAPESGPQVDFYSFGAIAYALLSGKRFPQSGDLNWNIIPNQWRSFLQSCLNPDPQRRPRDFLEIEDWLAQPELALTAFEGDADAGLLEKVVDAPAGDDSFTQMLHSFQHSRQATAQALGLTAEQKVWLEKQIDAGLRSARTAKWKEARRSFKEALKVDPGNSEVHVHLAIACYELEDMKNAEQHYEMAKKIDPQTAKRFREHIAFKM